MHKIARIHRRCRPEDRGWRCPNVARERILCVVLNDCSDKIPNPRFQMVQKIIAAFKSFLFIIPQRNCILGLINVLCYCYLSEGAAPLFCGRPRFRLFDTWKVKRYLLGLQLNCATQKIQPSAMARRSLYARIFPDRVFIGSQINVPNNRCGMKERRKQ